MLSTMTMSVEFIGGPWDGHRQDYPCTLDREDYGAWMLLPDGTPWPPDVPDGCAPRAVYEPDPEQPTRWVYQHTICV